MAKFDPRKKVSSRLFWWDFRKILQSSCFSEDHWTISSVSASKLNILYGPSHFFIFTYERDFKNHFLVLLLHYDVYFYFHFNLLWVKHQKTSLVASSNLRTLLIMSTKTFIYACFCPARKVNEQPRSLSWFLTN